MPSAEPLPGRCGAKLAKRDGYCARPAGDQTDHHGFGRCKFHFGSTPTGIIRAEKERFAMKLAEAAETYELDPKDPLESLLAVHDRFAAIAAWTADGVDQLDIAEGSLITEGVPHVLYAMHREALRDLAGVAKTLVDLGVNVARLHLDAARIESVVRALITSLASAGLNATQQLEVRRAFIDQLALPEATD